MNFFESIPKDLRFIVYSYCQLKDLARFSQTRSIFKEEITVFISTKLKQESFYQLKENESPLKVYDRLQQLKKLFIEAEYFRRNFVYHSGTIANDNENYSEHLAKAIITTIPHEERIETHFQKLLDPTGKAAQHSIFDILRRARKYKKNDEYICMQTPYLIKFLTAADFSAINQSKRNFDRKAFRHFLKNPQLVSQVNPELLHNFVNLDDRWEIFDECLKDNEEIVKHLSQVPSIANALFSYFEELETLKIFGPRNIQEPGLIRGSETDIDDSGSDMDNQSDEFHMGSYRF